MNPRGTPSDEAPFVWASSAALERIERGLGGTRAAFATATYIALCRLANERGTPTLREHISLIAHLSGLGTTTTREMLRELEQLELVAITLNKLPHSKGNDASSYVLCGTSSAMRGTSNAGQGTSSAAGDTQRVGCFKKGKEGIQEEGGDAPARGASAEVPDLKQAAASVMADGIPADFIALAHADWMDNGGCNAKGTPKPWPGYVRTRWRYEAGEWKSGKHRGQAGSRPVNGKAKGSVPDHSKGFFEGTELEKKPAPR